MQINKIFFLEGHYFLDIQYMTRHDEWKQPSFTFANSA